MFYRMKSRDLFIYFIFKNECLDYSHHSFGRPISGVHWSDGREKGKGAMI